jgi:uncharacterized protein
VKALAWQPCEVHSAQAGAPLRLEARRLHVSPASPVAPISGGAAVIAPPHPLYGGTFDNPVVIGIADGFARSGIGSLAFNWRGIEGSSGDKTDSLEAAVADYRGALAALAGVAPLLAAGYSFGAGAAVLAACEEPSLLGLVLLAPPLGLLRAEDLLATRAKLLLIVGDDDEYAPVPELTRLLAGRPDTELVVLRGADHFFHFGGQDEIAATVASRVSTWLA